MFKQLVAGTAATLFALAVAPANAEHRDVPHGKGDTPSIEEILSLLGPKTIFVTSERYTGDLVAEAVGLGDFVGDGLAAADAICQDHADGAGLTGEYVAVLSSSEENANARLTPSLGPYRLVDGTPVAANYAALFSTRTGSTTADPNTDLPPIQLIAAVNMKETGVGFSPVLPLDTRLVWTGSTTRGEVLTDGNPLDPPMSLPRISTCDDWTNKLPPTNGGCTHADVQSPGACGAAGLASVASFQWIDSGISHSTGDNGRELCSRMNRLYCAEK